MKEKNKIKIRGYYVLIFILIIVLGFVIVLVKSNEKKYLEEISDLNQKVTALEGTPINISQKIALNGVYAIPESHSSWEFTPNGKAVVFGNISQSEGIYRTIGNNFIVVHYTKNIEWDDYGKETITDVDWYDYIYVDENNDIYWINSNEMPVKLEKL